MNMSFLKKINFVLLVFSIISPMNAMQKEELGDQIVKAAQDDDIKKLQDFIKGVDINTIKTSRNNSIMEALAMSLRNPSQEAIKILLDAGANVNESIFDWVTPAAQGDSQSISILKLMADKKYKVNVNLKNEKGESPLVIAIKTMQRNGFPTIEIILNMGVDPNIEDNKGKTALDYAYERKFPENSIKLLISHDAKKGSGAAKAEEHSKQEFTADNRPVVSKSVYRKLTGKESVSATPYEILGLSAAASQDDIRNAWKKKTLSWHPDRSKDPEAKQATQLINWAYEQLKK